MFGLFAIGAGIAIPYASAPRVGLATLPQTQAGKGSGMLNSCSFLGGTIGVTCGGIVFGLAGFPGVLAMLGPLGVRRRGALLAAARSVKSGAYRRWLTFPICEFPHSLQSVWVGFPRSQGP